jgi:hypothetical protein
MPSGTYIDQVIPESQSVSELSQDPFSVDITSRVEYIEFAPDVAAGVNTTGRPEKI